jgi:hypothetical protein
VELSVDRSISPSLPTPGATSRGDLLERPSRLVESVPVPAPPRPRQTRLDDDSALVSTGPGIRTSEPAPRVPTQTTAGGSPSTAYGDWTKPRGAGDTALATDPHAVDAPARRLRDRIAPGTTAIPERSTSPRRPAAEPDDAESPAAVPGPGTGPGAVVGGRAAQRAERQAADAARRKSEKRSGSAVAVLDREDDEPRRPRRVVKGLVAMTVVALGVLGVYSFVSPETQEVASQSPAAASTSSTPPAPPSPLPDLPQAPVDVEPIVAGPVRVPVTVLNSTNITGLAAKIAASIGDGGWEAPATGAYTADDVAASTVFFTEGDENQRQAAVQLVDQFPELQGPAPRFFELPADIAAPGLVVVATGDWQP